MYRDFYSFIYLFFIFIFIFIFSVGYKKAGGGKRMKYIPEWTNSRKTTSLWPKSKSKVASWSLKERFRSHQKCLPLIGCCKIIYRAISVVIFFLVWMRRLAAGVGVGVRSMSTGSFGWGGLMLQDPKPPMNPKETSLIHPDPSMKMYDINLKNGQRVLFTTIPFNISHLFALTLNVKQLYLTHRWNPTRCYHSGPEWVCKQS